MTSKEGEKPPDGLAGLHIIFGPRVIKFWEQPPNVWIEVHLLGPWKRDLNADKTELRIHQDELNAAVGEHLRDWLAAQAKQPKTYKTKILTIVSEDLTRRLNRITPLPHLEKTIPGEHKAEPRALPDPDKEKRPRPPPKPEPPPKTKRRAKAVPGGKFGVDYGPSAWAIQIAMDENGARTVPIARIVLTPQRVIWVYLNSANKAVTAAFQLGGSGASGQVGWLAICQLANYIAEGVAKKNPISVQVLRAMTADGFDLDDPDEENNFRSISGSIVQYLLDDEEPAENVVPFPGVR